MPKFLDAPQWYNSNGVLTNQATLFVGVVQVAYKNSNETIEVKAYFPSYSAPSEISRFTTPLHYYSLLATIAQQDLYSLCTGQLRINTTKRADISYMVFTTSGSVIFKANNPTLGLGDSLTELSVSLGVSEATSYYFQGPGGGAYLD